MPTLELKVPPVVVVLVTAALMWLVAWATRALGFLFRAHGLIAMGLALVGLLICVMGVASFKRARTTVNPMTPGSSSSLVQWGVYGLTRNPMYLGLSLILLGWTVFLSNVLAFCLLPAFVLYMNRFQIEPEEKALTLRFGQEFIAYASRVRRWL